MILGQYVKFVIVGSVNTLVSFAIFFACHALLHCGYFVALAVSYVIGVLNSFYWNRLWTFGGPQTGGKNFIKFVSVYIATFFLNLFSLYLLVDVCGCAVVISQGCLLFIMSMISFAAHKYWSFKVEETKRNEVCIDK